MKKSVFLLFSVFLVFSTAGCDSTGTIPTADETSDIFSSYADYAPSKVGIMPLTTITYADDPTESSKLNVFVCMLDSFGSQVKSPAVFRFELYQYLRRSNKARGERLFIWPDIDLKDPAANNAHWRDFLRAYEFDLDFQPPNQQSCVLQVTCFCPDGKRLPAEFILKNSR